MKSEVRMPQSAFSLAVSPSLGEFDLGGVLYHANYFHLYEQGREALLQQIDFSYSLLVKGGFHLAVVESHQNFIAPITYGQSITLNLWVSDLKKASLVFHYQLAICADHDAQNSAVKVIHQAWTRHALVHTGVEGFGLVSFDPDFRSKLALFGV